MRPTESFLSDIEEIRRRARQHLTAGAVTQNYGGNVEDAIALLNHAVATEIVCVLRYKFHAVCATGLASEAVKEEFSQHAKEEAEHLDLLAERINQLGGKPDLNPDGVGARAASEYVGSISVPEVEIAKDVAHQTTRPPLPPFARETAIQKVRLAEDGWNSRDPQKVSLAYALDSRWRNRSEFVNGRLDIIAFLTRKWARELDYRLIKELWAFEGNRIAVRFAYEWHDDSGNWYRSYGNENWEFNEDGPMRWRLACINDVPIKQSDRKYHWPLGRRPDSHPGLTDLGF